MSFPKRLHDALNYNEQKVAKGVATLLDASGYLRKGPDLNFYHKLEGLQLRNSLNERANSHTIHISLNFSPGDRKLDESTLKSIARDYMQGIGFEGQPYLVYQHRDAGHPHLHIVSTTIRKDGSRIPTHNLGRDQSSRTREALEQTYKLLPAKGRIVAAPSLSLFTPATAQYGKEETRAAIARVVAYVFRQYAVSSLHQYNAALRQFDVVADSGKEDSRIYRHGGLVYRLLGEKGGKTGVPIKASILPGKPTLAALQQKFAAAGRQKEWAKPALRGKVDRAMLKCSDLSQLKDRLATAGVFVLPHVGATGSLYGITFLDNRSRTVFNGSELGKEYSAAALQAKFSSAHVGHAATKALLRNIPLKHTPCNIKANTPHGHLSILGRIAGAPVAPWEPTVPAALTKKRRRKPKGSHTR